MAGHGTATTTAWTGARSPTRIPVVVNRIVCVSDCAFMMLGSVGGCRDWFGVNDPFVIAVLIHRQVVLPRVCVMVVQTCIRRRGWGVIPMNGAPFGMRSGGIRRALW